MDLEHAVKQFDLSDANLGRLQAVWDQMQELVPSGVVFPGGSPEEARYDELMRAFADLTAGLPAIDGYRVTAQPLSLSEIAHGRHDAWSISEPEAEVQLLDMMTEPVRELAEYRHRLSKARKKLVRQRVAGLISEVDGLLADLGGRWEWSGDSVADDVDWIRLREAIKETERLLASDLVRKGRWRDLARHLGFAQAGDLHDIINHDWPSVRVDIEAALYGELEPLPVEVADLGALAETQPEGPVTTALKWDALTDDDFERLIFNLLTTAAGYENARWLMKTRAPDRGRDLSVDRVFADSLSEVRRSRVIVQCRHWRSRSMNAEDCITAVGLMSLWEPPLVDVLIVASSGRFTADAVQWVDNHNHAGARPQVELWAESHLESLLAARPALVTELGLR